MSRLPAIALCLLEVLTVQRRWNVSSSQEHGHVVETPPLEPAEQRKKFKLPPGFEIQLVASEPDVVKPMNLAFDDRGRLLVTQSYEYPYPAKADQKGRDTVKLLEDFGPDGRARKVRTYADGLNIPIGVAAVRGGALAHSIPKVWRLVDKDGDGVVESREAIYGDHDSRDTHGMLNAFTPWVDGWIYACHGFANQSTLRCASGQSISMNSGNTWRMKADGSRLEHYSFGQVNPFGMCFDALGNVYTSDCHSKPAYQVLRGGWYPTFDGRHDGLGHGPPLMNHIHGSTGLAGVVHYSAAQFPPEYRDTLFIGNPITHRVNHDRLEATGASLKAVEQPDFLRCDDPWFRPVDLKLAPDGTLYVADFYNCIIGHYEVPLDHPKRDRTRGRIWRIVHTGTAPKPMPDLDKAAVADLVELLKDETLTVRVMATNQLADRGASADVKAILAGEPHAFQKAHGLWVLERLSQLDEPLVRKLAGDPDRLVRTHLMKALAERRSWTFEAALAREKLADADPWVRRAAAEALGLHPDPANVRPLLALWSATPAGDTHLVYQARMAVRNQLLAPGVYDSLGDADPDRIANVSVGARTPESAKWLLGYLKNKPLTAPHLHHVARYAPEESLAAVFELAKAVEKQAVRERLGSLQSLHQALQERGAPMPPAFVELSRAVVRAALDGNAGLDALKFARDLKLKALFDDIAQVAANPQRPWDARAAALDALAALDADRALPLVSKAAADTAERADVRLRALGALGGMNTAGSRAALVELLRNAPLQGAVAVAVALAGSREGGEALLAAVAEGKAPARVLLERAVDGRLRASKLEDRMKKLTADLPPEDDRIKKLIDARRAGFAAAKADAARGAEVYKKACSGCHVLAGAGKKVGPELDGVAHRGLDRILEDVLDPNRAVDQAFRATMIKTTDGRVVSGLVLREEGEVLVVQEAVDKETRVAKKDIEQRQLSQLSPMPANVIDPMPEAEFYDLLAFLLAQRPK